MGKSEGSEMKRSKKHKRHHKSDKSEHKKSSTPKPTENKPINEEPQQIEVYEEDLAGFEHEEEIMCDGEVELTTEQDAEMIDVEESIDDDLNSTPTPTPTPYPTPTKSSSTSKSSSSKKSTTKQSITNPSSGKTTPAATTSNAIGSISNNANNSNNNNNSAKKSKSKRRDSGTSSEEERWLTAIESGKLEDVDDELKKIKDPKLMTARQRAMYERQLDKEPTSPGAGFGVELLMSLPSGYREKEKPQTAEDIQKAALKSQKRKQQADEKREKDKKKTMERLLKKQESGKKGAAARSKINKAAQPTISYRNTRDGAFILLPPEHEFPLAAQAPRAPPKVQLCGIAGCGQPKVYNCSKTNLPLCSFACYRKHVQAVRQIMC